MDFDKMKHAVKSIEMSKAMEKSVKANCKNAEREKMPRSNFKSRLSVACAFGIVMLMLVGIPFFSNNGDFQAANFAITAYALSDDGNQSNTKISSEKATFELSTEVRGSTTDITGDVGNLIFTKVMLNISGEHIDSITYTISKGKFIEDVTLTAKESTDKDWLLSEKIFMIGNSPGSDIYHGTKEIGNTYRVKYNEQDKYKYSLAIPHDGNLVIEDDIMINAIVKYTDGKSEQQDIIVTQESDSISLVLK